MLLDKIMVPAIKKANLEFQAFWGGIPYRLVKLQTFRKGMFFLYRGTCSGTYWTVILGKLRQIPAVFHEPCDVLVETKSSAVFLSINNT